MRYVARELSKCAYNNEEHTPGVQHTPGGVCLILSLTFANIRLKYQSLAYSLINDLKYIGNNLAC